MDIKSLSIEELVKKIKSKEFSAKEVTKYYLANIEKYKGKNAVLEVFEDAVEIAEDIDRKIASGADLGLLAGVPVIIKDNMLYEGKKCTCASKFLKDYVSQYTSTAVQKLIDQDAVIIGRANMDEFAMGGSCEHSAFGACKNAYDDTRVSGGSSGGSAVAVALDMCAFALGSDTGGSIRQPSSFNGMVGLKPTYGRVSRYGLVAFASSLDQIGPITKSVEDAKLVLKVIAGKDINDQTTADEPLVDSKPVNLKGLKFGVISQVDKVAKNSKYYAIYKDIEKKLALAGADIVSVDIPEYELSLSSYYVIQPAEATSNLGRFDGVKYTTRAGDVSGINDLYKKSRTEGFGDEVKRRIMLGNFALSSGYYDAYYKNAKRVQKLLKTKFEEAFKKVDAIIMPTTYGEAFEIGSKTKDPVSMYAEDMFTIVANLAGVPAVSVPCGKGESGLPLGLQVVGKHFDDLRLLEITKEIQKEIK
ncbi:MAG: Asp-tRNA(Asn)/Glu-tRNA(Gln) amidotransferase subunit GatA [Clostridia bacterium]|nr:Asp-tRNA(Asn)/Glu-tRNA(Gln) amidotransferase subunit GatA [Clostridia bacterium]